MSNCYFFFFFPQENKANKIDLNPCSLITGRSKAVVLMLFLVAACWVTCFRVMSCLFFFFFFFFFFFSRGGGVVVVVVYFVVVLFVCLLLFFVVVVCFFLLLRLVCPVLRRNHLVLGDEGFGCVHFVGLYMQPV